MQRIVTVIVRKKDGQIAIVNNREQIACDDDFGGVQKLTDAEKKKSPLMVLVLDETDAVLRHWTKPVEAGKAE